MSLDRDMSRQGLRATAVPDTTILGYWTFDSGAGQCDPQGWTSHDLTAGTQGLFSHVDDFAGLGGGDFGRLVPLEGGQSWWIGARADSTSDELCGYATLPGYGQNWSESLATVNCLSVTGDVTMDFLFTWDSEPGYDGTAMQYDLCDDNWITIDHPLYDPYHSPFIDGVGVRELISATVPDSLHSGSVRLRTLFISDGAWSDEDGSFNTDGGGILDSLTVSDAGGVVLPTELFEAESVGDQATVSGNWEAGTLPGYGDLAALYQGATLVQEDPCRSNISCVWGFFNGSTADYGCGGWPSQPAVPYGNERDQYIANEVWSPWVPITGTGSTFEVGFDVYRDLPVNPLVFFVWHVRFLVDGCPTYWLDRNFFHFGPDKDWLTFRETFGDLLAGFAPGATHVQMAMGVIDICPSKLYGGDCQCHSHAPLMDNAFMRRIDTKGPVWSVRDIALFQDNFAEDGTTTGTVRADAAVDILHSANPNYHPGDSVVVQVDDPVSGLAVDPYTGSGSAVYAYVGVWPQGQAGKSGGALTSDTFRWPVVDSLSHDGDAWYVIRMDASFGLDRYTLDLNDSLFTPGDTVCYVFSATGAGPGAGTTYYTRFTGATDDLAYALNNPMEFTCLPVTGPAGGRRILYVDNFDGLGAQPFFDTAFDMLGIAGEVDRYDVLGSLSEDDNGLGYRVVDPVVQLAGRYHTIIWNSGDLDEGTLKDTGQGEGKVDDAAVLKAFLDNLTVPGGLYLSGDNLGSDWDNHTNPGAIALRGTYMNFTVLDNNHIYHGLGTSPLVMGVDGGCFDHIAGPDTLVAFGGCPGINRFDVLQASGSSSVEAHYGAGVADAAILGQKTTNPQAVDVGVVLSGFSYHEIRDAEESGIPARVEHLKDILTWLGSLSPTPTGAEAPRHTNSLAQNYPNPFNPSTTVEFTVRERARVTLRVYNVAGQLVTTLVDDESSPGVIHAVSWDGTNRDGQRVASGVYFCRLETKGFTETKKMVLLK